MLQELIKQLGAGGDANDRKIEGIINLQRQLANQSLNANVPITINIPDGMGGREVINLTQQVKILREDIAALNPSAGANPTPTPTAGNTP